MQGRGESAPCVCVCVCVCVCRLCVCVVHVCLCVALTGGTGVTGGSLAFWNHCLLLRRVICPPLPISSVGFSEGFSFCSCGS